MARKQKAREKDVAARESAKRARPAKRKGKFSEADRQRALELLLSGRKRASVAAEIGCSTEALRLWVRAAEAKLAECGNGAEEETANAASPDPKEATTPAKVEPAKVEPAVEPAVEPETAAASTAPKDPGAGLSDYEVQAILDLKKRHPAMGPAQLRAQLKRFKGWRISLRAIARALRANGYELEHRGGRPEEPEPPRRWEAPYRNALWQTDFTEVRIPEGRRALGVIVDDFSRFVVGWGLFESPTSEDVVDTLKEAIRLHGKPLAIYTDRGGPFLCWSKPEGFQRFLEAELIDHHTTPAYRPQGRGKIESLLGTVKRELWEIEEFADEAGARAALERFFFRYNHERAHLGLDGLTPADRFFGRWQRVLSDVQALSRKRHHAADGVRSDVLLSSEDPPRGQVEILRLVASDGELELRFFGHRVRLGKIES